MTVPTGAPPSAPITYVPGGWLAIVAGDLALLADLRPTDPALGACWGAAMRNGGVDGVLDALGDTTSFVLAGPDGSGGIRLVVAGAARAEVTAAAGESPTPVTSAPHIL